MEPTTTKDCCCNMGHDGPCPSNRVSLEPVAAAVGRQMFGVIEKSAPATIGPGWALALFPEEHAAWRWLLNPGGERGPRGKFGPAPEDLTVRPFVVAEGAAR